MCGITASDIDGVVVDLTTKDYIENRDAVRDCMYQLL